MKYILLILPLFLLSLVSAVGWSNNTFSNSQTNETLNFGIDNYLYNYNDSFESGFNNWNVYGADNIQTFASIIDCTGSCKDGTKALKLWLYYDNTPVSVQVGVSKNMTNTGSAIFYYTTPGIHTNLTIFKNNVKIADLIGGVLPYQSFSFNYNLNDIINISVKRGDGVGSPSNNEYYLLDLFAYQNYTQNITRYLLIPQNLTNFTKAFLNLSSGNCYQETANQSNSLDRNCNLNYSGSYFFNDNVGQGQGSVNWGNPNNLIDGDYNTYADWSLDLKHGYLFINYTKPLFSNSSIWHIKDSKSTRDIPIPSNCFNNQTDKISLKIDIVPSLTTYTCLGSTGFIEVNSSANNNIVYEEGITWISTPSNVSFLINNTQVFYYPGNFNVSNNRTLNFASAIQNYTNSCNYFNGYCQIPIFFHSDTNASLFWSDFYVEGYENITPQINVLSPNSTFTGVTEIDLNFTAYDNFQLDSCFYNVTFSNQVLIVPNTKINCYANRTFNLPGISGTINGLIFNMMVNDTSGNFNTTTKTFNIAQYITPVFNTGGGGGSISSTPINVSIYSTSYGSLIDLILAKGSVLPRSKQIMIINYATSDIGVSLSCDPTNYSSVTPINICDYVNFSSDSFTVSPNELEPSYIDVNINTPPTAEYGDVYNFNILGTGNGYTLNNPKISVSVRVPIYATVLKASYVPIQDPTIPDSEKYSYYTFPVAFIIGLFVAILFYLIFRKLELTAILISLLFFLITMGVLLYYL